MPLTPHAKDPNRKEELARRSRDPASFNVRNHKDIVGRNGQPVKKG